MTLERLKEIRQRIWDSHGWDDGETPEERREIKVFWETLPGHTSHYDAVCMFIRELGKTS